LARDIAVHSTVLRSFEGEGSVGDDCRIEFYELAAFCGLQINGIAIGSAFYCSGYGVTVTILFSATTILSAVFQPIK